MPEPPSERFERTAYNVYNVYLQLSVVLNNFFQMNFKRFFALFHFVVPLLLLLLDKIILQNHFYPNWTSLVGSIWLIQLLKYLQVNQKLGLWTFRYTEKTLRRKIDPTLDLTKEENMMLLVYSEPI